MSDFPSGGIVPDLKQPPVRLGVIYRNHANYYRVRTGHSEVAYIITTHTNVYA